jgi:hypothetical protein
MDLEDRLLAHFGPDRRGAMGPNSRAKCAFKRVCEELSSTYYEPPRVRHPAQRKEHPDDPAPVVEALVGPEGMISATGLWSQMRRFQVLVLGLREAFIRVDWDARRNGLTYRQVGPEWVVAKCRIADPTKPIEVRELRWRDFVGGGKWCWDILSIVDPENPVYRVIEANLDPQALEVDRTADALGGDRSGANYPYRWTQGDRRGDPFLPYVLYHAEDAGCLFDAWNWTELVEASLDIACLWTFWQHGVFRASWPQRYAINAYVAGTVSEDGDAGRRSAVPTDPTSLVHLEPGEPGTQPQVGQWGTSADVKSMGEAIAAFENTVIAITGIDGAHIMRQSADAVSGAALSISRDGKREAQRVYAPQFRPRDVELVEKSAALVNVAMVLAEDLPEDGYRVDYGTVPLSPQELEARRKHHGELIAAGRMSPIEAYMEEHPGTTEDEAREALVDVRLTGLRIEQAAKVRAEGEGLIAAPDEGEALTGITIDKGMQIVREVAAGVYSRASGKAMLMFLVGKSDTEAEAMLADAGQGFQPQQAQQQSVNPIPEVA